MTVNYKPMWKLNLDAHDALLGVLNKAYSDIYLSLQDRPKGMEYFDFVMSKVHGLGIQEHLDEQEKGRKISGSYYIFVPEEIDERIWSFPRYLHNKKCKRPQA